MGKSKDYKRHIVFILILLILVGCNSQTKRNQQEEKISSAATLMDDKNDQTLSIYSISNRKSGLFLRPFKADKKDGNKIVLYPEFNWECLKWEMEPVGDNSFYLKNLFTHKTIQPENGSLRSVNIVQQPLNQNDLQQWSFIKMDNGYFKIEHPQSGLFLTAQGKDMYNMQVFISEWENLEEQQWQMKAVSADSGL